MPRFSALYICLFTLHYLYCTLQVADDHACLCKHLQPQRLQRDHNV